MNFKRWQAEYNNKNKNRKAKKVLDFLFLPVHGFLAYMFVQVFFAFLMFDLNPEKFDGMALPPDAWMLPLERPIFIWLPALMAVLKIVNIIVTDVKFIFFDK